MNETKVHEIFAYPHYRQSRGEKYLESYLAYFAKLILPLRVISFFSSPCRFVGRKGSAYAFHTARLADIMAGLDRRETLILGKPQELLFAVRHWQPFYPVYEFIPELFRLYGSDPLLESRAASRLVSRGVKLFTRAGTKKLILWNDSLFLERFLVFCARQAGVQSVCVQHGIFQSTTDIRILDGHYADQMLVWGESQQQLYRHADFPAGKVRILGYPFHLPKIMPGSSVPPTVCILGQHWESCSSHLGKKKMKLFSRVIENFNAAGITVCYKPHPYEERTFIPANATVVKDSLAAALEKFGVFISLTSTALIEASLCGKIAVQLFDEEFAADDYKEKEYCYSHGEVETLVDFVLATGAPYRIPAEVIFVPEDLGAQFKAVIDQPG